MTNFIRLGDDEHDPDDSSNISLSLIEDNPLHCENAFQKSNDQVHSPASHSGNYPADASSAHSYRGSDGITKTGNLIIFLRRRVLDI